MRIEYHSGANPEQMRRHAAELIALPADIVVANGTTAPRRWNR